MTQRLKITARLGAAAGAALALVTMALAAQERPAEPKYTEVKYSADASSYKWDGADRILTLTGNVKFVHGDTTLLADRVDYRESTGTAVARGGLKIFDPQDTITGDACTVNFKQKKGSVTGGVRLVVKPAAKGDDAPDSDDSKPKPIKSEWKDETLITCDTIDYYYKEKRAVVPTALTITQKKRVVTADSGVYFVKDELAKLSGNVKGRDEKNRHNFTAPSVTVSLKETDQWVQAEKATGSFYMEDEDESKPTGAKAK